MIPKIMDMETDWQEIIENDIPLQGEPPKPDEKDPREDVLNGLIRIGMFS